MKTAEEIGREIKYLRCKSDIYEYRSFDAFDPSVWPDEVYEADQEIYELMPALADAEAKTPEGVIAKLEGIQYYLSLLEDAVDPEAEDAACQMIQRLLSTSLAGMEILKGYFSIYLTTKELAERWRCSTGHLESMRLNRVGPNFTRFSRSERGKVYYRLEDIEEWERKNEVECR